MPDILAAIKKVKGEQPDQADTSVEPRGLFGRLLGGNSQATTNPFTGSISYNPEALNKLSPPELENLMVHELTHSRQVQQTPYLQRLGSVMQSMIPGIGNEDYYQRPREMEAFQAERNRSMQQGQSVPDPASGATDINLPAPSPRRKILGMFTNDRGTR